MGLELPEEFELEFSVFDPVEDVLEAAGWPFEQGDEHSIQAIAPTRWGEMGTLFAFRPEPAALHISLTLDIRPLAGRKAQLAELVMLANERLWLGHFDYWQEDGLILWRHALPLMERSEPSHGEISAVLAAAVDAVDRFVPAFNFLIWAGKSPSEAMEAALFETQGEA